MTSTDQLPTSLDGLTGEWTLDPTHTRIGFVARHAMVTKVRGSFNEFEGSARVEGEDLASAAVQVTIQAASIDTRNEQRDGHLRTNDFLAIDEHPTVEFRSTSVARTGDESFDLTGDLTLRGVTRSVTIPFTFEGVATDPFGNLRAGFEGSVEIDREDYGITFNAALETGGVLVSKKVTLEFEVSAIRNA